MREDLLHYVWRLGRFNMENLRTTTAEEVVILQKGQINQDAGPDFLNARIRIGGTEWAGNVEMHLKSSDWERHAHSDDAAYHTVILHVVWEEDVPVYRPSGERIPCLELSRRIPKEVKTNYLRLLHNEKRIPCEGLQEHTPPMVWRMWLERLVVERLATKVQPIEQAMRLTANNGEEVFYRFLAKTFGMKVNAEPFERLARATPLAVLAKHQGQLFQIEALLFGQAGLLGRDFEEDYPQRLKKEYAFLQKKYQLQPIHLSEWKFLRLRPANFPSIRIAQLAALINKSSRLFSRVVWAKDFQQLLQLFDVEVSDYWQTHYVMDKVSKKRKKSLGKTLVRSIAINAVVPFLFHYGQRKDEPHLMDRALDMLAELRPEKNKIINLWKDLGLQPQNAKETQALLQLYNGYCTQKKCLSCMVGHCLVGKEKTVHSA